MAAPDLLPVLADDDEGAPVPALVPLAEQARDYARRARAENTRRAYRAAWRDFAAWCGTRGAPPLPAAPTLVGLYLADRAAALKVASLRLRLVAIRQAHALAGHRLDTTAPEIAEVMKPGFPRWIGVQSASCVNFGSSFNLLL